jgi:hypothetical protein
MTFRYVPFSRVEEFLQMGWIVGNYASHHSILMRACICNPQGKPPQ